MSSLVGILVYWVPKIARALIKTMSKHSIVVILPMQTYSSKVSIGYRYATLWREIMPFYNGECIVLLTVLTLLWNHTSIFSRTSMIQRNTRYFMHNLYQSWASIMQNIFSYAYLYWWLVFAPHVLTLSLYPQCCHLCNHLWFHSKFYPIQHLGPWKIWE